jgi:hypothetical protein
MTVNDPKGPDLGSRTWDEYAVILREFLKSKDSFLFLDGPITEEYFQRVKTILKSSEVDLVQFHSIKFFGRGTLGIPEWRWVISNCVTGSQLFRRIVRDVSRKKPRIFYGLVNRCAGMLHRRSAVERLLGDLTKTGIVIPHYIEPGFSTLVISRNFGSALLEYNANGVFSLHRACFALARSSNFLCFRVSPN